MQVETDEDLMQRYAQGEVAAFNSLFERYERRAYAFFLSRTRDVSRTWDLYQELFLRLHRFRSTYANGARFAPWFFQIAQHVLVDDVRRARARPEEPLRADPGARPGLDAPTRLALRGEAERALAALSPVQRSVLLRAKVEGESYAQIAERLGTSTDAVKQMASRALRMLRAMAESKA